MDTYRLSFSSSGIFLDVEGTNIKICKSILKTYFDTPENAKDIELVIGKRPGRYYYKVAASSINLQIFEVVIDDRYKEKIFGILPEKYQDTTFYVGVNYVD